VRVAIAATTMKAFGIIMANLHISCGTQQDIISTY